jgi:hypothetical protein
MGINNPDETNEGAFASQHPALTRPRAHAAVSAMYLSTPHADSTAAAAALEASPPSDMDVARSVAVRWRAFVAGRQAGAYTRPLLSST